MCTEHQNKGVVVIVVVVVVVVMAVLSYCFTVVAVTVRIYKCVQNIRISLWWWWW